MSNYYNYRCHDCNEQSEDGVNHGREALQEAWDLREHLRALSNAKKCDFNTIGGHPPTYIIDFLLEHLDHRLSIIDEYNREDIPLGN